MELVPDPSQEHVEAALRYDKIRYAMQRFGEAQRAGFQPQPVLGGQKYPRFLIGIRSLDEEAKGETCHGVTLFVGASGLGKSYAAMGAALDNAYAGKMVLHIDAEMDQGLYNERVWAWHRSDKNRSLEDYGELEPEYYAWLPCPDEFAFEEISGVMLRMVQERHKGVVLIVDSLNSVTDRMKAVTPGENEFQKLYRFLSAASKLSRDSNGLIGWILVSEVKGDKTVFGGERMKHRCNQVYDFAFDENTGGTKIACTRNRDGELKDHGLFFIDYKNARVRKHGKEMSVEEMEREAF